MSFWSDSSPIVKGAIVLGAVGLVLIALLWSGVFDSGGDAGPATHPRGLPTAGQ